jgi:hypothetical protein
MIEIAAGTQIVDHNGKRHTVSEPSVLIPRSKLEELQMESAKLAALEAGGVDNWTWYSDSLKDHMEPAMYRKLMGDDEDADDD